ncbi:IS21-like element helper ATPase IstB [Globicatella sulfidifaciens]|uniref:ATP-binding protein n=1 Tax=Globicatella sulfidifaciens TaxID=136093 RepID=A0A7X8C374_9LACT|nr:IS21-like element helper ATPase IstB [Globicatella sulfidifaciens]NLJ17959.1 ATP-binding protein [Globicatella sulfidifaciens]
MNSSYMKLIENLKYLKLNQMVIHLDETIDFMNNNNLSFIDALIKLTDYEIDMKEINMVKAMVKVAAFPHLKEIKDFDFSFQPSINKEQILDFTTLRFIEQKENIVFLGSSGVGKTHLATSIGIAAAKKRTSTYFIKCHDLIMNLKKAKLENRLEARLKHYSRYKLLIIDEIGYLPIDEEDAKLFFQLIDMRYEKKSTVFTTNASFKSWGEIFQDPKIANAILDRILHHATVINIVGDSYRLKDHIQTEKES